VWALVFVLALLAWRGHWEGLRQAIRRPRVVALAAASAAILSLNWLLYVVAVQNGRVVEASLGYFINPLVNVLVGVAVLGERLRRAQWVAVGLAAAGVVWLSWSAGAPPWIALVLAVSFSIYGLLRKTSTLGPLEGLALETLLVAPVALPLLLWWSLRGPTFTDGGWAIVPWLVVLGPLTALPLMLFAAAARRLQLATVGLMQYISPTLQLLTGVLLLGEAFDAQRAIGFALIWSALAVYSAHAWHVHRQARTTP
jgi:chloramphenicol-sensitive protein RarD